MFKCCVKEPEKGGVEATGGKIVSCMVAREDGPQEEGEEGRMWWGYRWGYRDGGRGWSMPTDAFYFIFDIGGMNICWE